jgi:serine/threonine-protein kinase PRP4
MVTRYQGYRVGEILNGKYTVMGSFGKGVFSTVLRGRPTGSDKDVAIKILRNNEAM